MNLYCCKIVEQGWGTEYTNQKEYIWAPDPSTARDIICKMWEIRRNKKGLRIEEVPIVYAERISKYETRLFTEPVWNSFMQHAYEESSYREVKVYTCSNCKRETNGSGQVCRKCGAIFKKG
jgi:hypothetical protein